MINVQDAKMLYHKNYHGPILLQEVVVSSPSITDSLLDADIIVVGNLLAIFNLSYMYTRITEQVVILFCDLARIQSVPNVKFRKRPGVRHCQA
ncbi:MAG TPA: hypothetical protein VFS97_08105 [Nitrososphaeraceae archaeon]|nr:hypothetical protein [Nitrososphaeraceae archaeon]